MEPIKPGIETTEYKQARGAYWINVACIVLGVIVQTLGVLLPIFEGNEMVMFWVGLAIEVVTTVHNTMVSRGYIKGRSELKIAETQKG